MAQHENVKMKASELIEDFKLYPRNSVFDGHSADLAEAIRAGAVLPAIIADKSSKRIADGFHRRRGHIKVFGDDVELDVTLINYKSDADIVRDAIRRNATHGRRMTTADLARCALLAKQFKISREELASMMNVCRETLEGIVTRRTASTRGGEPVILRRPMEHLAGTKLTKAQESVVTHVGGHPAIQLARQLGHLIESKSLPDDDRLFEELKKLHTLLDDLLVTQ